MLIRIYGILVMLWGIVLIAIPWILGDHDSKGADMIISGLGLCVLLSGSLMMRRQP